MLKIVVAVPTLESAQQSAEWVRDFVDALPESLRMNLQPPALAGSSGREPGTVSDVAERAGATAPADEVAAQLERLAGYWPAYSGRLRRLHGSLVELGYEPHVPVQLSATRRASYISYLDPAGGRNLGNTNSGTFTFMRKDLRDSLADNPMVKVSRYATVHFDTEEAVDFILSVAEAERVRGLGGPDRPSR